MCDPGVVQDADDRKLRCDHGAPDQDFNHDQGAEVAVATANEQHSHVVHKELREAEGERLALEFPFKASAQEEQENQRNGQGEWDGQPSNYSQDFFNKGADEGQRDSEKQQSNHSNSLPQCEPYPSHSLR